MSHFIGLVFVNSENDLDMMLEPFDENTENEEYLEFTDCTDEIQRKFDTLPEKDERLDKDGKPWPYICDKEHYSTLESLAEHWFGYKKNEDGFYGYTCNPDAKWDWYAIGNRWDGYLFGKDGKEYNELPFDKVDWEKMFNDYHVPFCIVTRDGDWHERGEMGWFGISSNDKEQDVWADEVRSYVKFLAENAYGGTKDIVVYAVDFHI